MSKPAYATERPRAWTPGRALVGLATAFLLCAAPLPVRAESIIVVAPVFDHNDRILAILQATDTPVDIQRIGIDRYVPPQLWARATAETEPARLSDAKLIVIENAHINALDDIATDQGESLVAALPAFVKGGGTLVVVGGAPGFDSYPGSRLAGLLPVILEQDDGQNVFRQTRKRTLKGSGSDGLYVEHIHPVRKVRGEVFIDSTGPAFEAAPFGVRWPVGRGEVVAILGGAHEYYTPDAGHDRREFFTSDVWAELLLGFAGQALGQSLARTPLPDPSERPLPVVREGARVRAEYWFPGRTGGQLELATLAGARVWSGTASDGWFELPERLRHGVYRATWTRGKTTRTTPVRVGGAANPEDFDIRLFALAHGPSPFGLAPGEAAARARELLAAGFTSIVFMNHWSERRQSQRDIRALREIIGSGLDVVYMHSILPAHWGAKWPFAGPAPARTHYFDGRVAGWDIHDEAFRNGIDQLYDAVAEVRTFPRIRGLQPIEEFGDGARDSPSLAKTMKEHGLTGKERPGQPGWYQRESLRSDATRATFERFRAAANRFLPGVPLATYWPGSYWFVPDIYTHRITELAATNDELIGPGYGFQYPQFDTGWESVMISSNEIFAAQGRNRRPGRQAGIFAIGRDSIKGGRPVRGRAWRDTAWSALAQGATLLAYFDLASGDALAPLAPLHTELTRIGPWIAAAPRRPAPLSLLASWTTRTAGDGDESFRHGNCLMNLQRNLAREWEDFDVLLEEHLDAPSPETRAIVVAAAPLLTDASVAALVRFVAAGGVLIVEPTSARRSPAGPRTSDPWAPVRATGRVYDTTFRKGCEGAPKWTARLRVHGIEPRSSAAGDRVEARLRGGDQILHWMLLNHDESRKRVTGRARFDPAAYTWRDLRSDAPLHFEPGEDARISRELDPGEAAAFVAVARPAAELDLVATATDTRIEVTLTLRDRSGAPVADGYPVRIDVRNAAGARRIASAARSRVTKGGAATWSIPIPVDAPAGAWRVEATEAISELRRSAEVAVSALAGEAPGG